MLSSQSTTKRIIFPATSTGHIKLVSADSHSGLGNIQVVEIQAKLANLRINRRNAVGARSRCRGGRVARIGDVGTVVAYSGSTC